MKVMDHFDATLLNSMYNDSGDPARPGRPAKSDSILDYEPKLRTHHAGWAD